MTSHISYTNNPKPPKQVFFAAVVMIFFSALSAADSIGFVPYYVDGTESARTNEVALSNLPELGEEITLSPESVLPERIKISAIDLDLSLQNIESRDLEVLDAALKKGPIRYVDSARLGEKGNILIFGHSSRLPIVRNLMYKAFNRVSELYAGDSITIEGGGKAYLYSVTSIRSADASEAIIDLSQKQGTKLTLETCDTLTGKSARYILEADFVGTI